VTLFDALQRFVVEEARDTRLGLRGLTPAATLARVRLKERALVWWVKGGVPARLEVLEAHLSRLRQVVRR